MVFENRRVFRDQIIWIFLLQKRRIRPEKCHGFPAGAETDKRSMAKWSVSVCDIRHTPTLFFICPGMSNSLQPHGLQHARPPLQPSNSTLGYLLIQIKNLCPQNTYVAGLITALNHYIFIWENDKDWNTSIHHNMNISKTVGSDPSFSVWKSLYNTDLISFLKAL